ncbi:hypothetical protein [Tenacibaculum mesophilum]|uniref:hypothetical protein n=1 Tax=Tenacibaculum mesophilum TaxID=104268 RepID=UPI00064A3546|nr:hypothetical protein [Tenacibaculum mesophilum]
MPSFVPLGIADYSGNSERGFVQFTYQIADNNAKELTLQIRDGSSVIFEEKITDANKLKQGEHIWKWDGFDSGGILDTAKLTQYENLNLYTIGVDSSNNYSRKKLDFSMRYDEVKWVDVKIDKNSKRIDVTLRVNLKDGGAKGIECYEKDIDPDPKLRVPMKVCPWDKIPEEDINKYGKEPIKERNKSFEDLKQLALDGINKYWSRYKGNVGDGIKLNEELYEVFVNAVYDKKGMVAPKLIYFTNSENSTFNRSHNWELSRKLFYKEGYLKSKKWLYIEPSKAKKRFEETAAHEVGHELLAELKGEYHSYTHKGTSHWSVILQDPVSGTTYPTSGEIDLMKYADDYLPVDYYSRVILSERDLLGLIWLSKLKIQ